MKKTDPQFERKERLVKESVAYNTTSMNQVQDNRYSTKPPCQYTLEELTDNIERAILDFKMGKGIPHEQIKRKTFE